MNLLQDLAAIANPMFKMKGPSMIQNNYSPAFPLKHQQKDMRLAIALGDENAVSMPVAAAANEVNHSPPRIHHLYITCTPKSICISTQGSKFLLRLSVEFF